MGALIFGIIMGVISLFGLFLASRAQDEMFSLAGYLFFLFGLVFVFGLIHRYSGQPTKH